MPKLRPCRFCGHPLAPSAETCPSCGGKVARQAGCLSALLGLILFGVIIFFCAGFFLSWGDSPNLESTKTPPSSSVHPTTAPRKDTAFASTGAGRGRSVASHEDFKIPRESSYAEGIQFTISALNEKREKLEMDLKRDEAAARKIEQDAYAKLAQRPDYKAMADKAAAMSEKIKTQRDFTGGQLDGDGKKMARELIGLQGKIATMKRKALANDESMIAANKTVAQQKTAVAQVKKQIEENEQKLDRQRKIDKIYANEKLREFAKKLGYEAAKKVLPDIMKNPASTNIPEKTIEAVEVVPGKEYKVSGIVYGTNDFGAVVPTSWAISMTYDDLFEKWDFESVQIGDQTYPIPK